MAKPKISVGMDLGTGPNQTVMTTVVNGTVVAVDELQPLPEPEGGWPADEFTGVGGRYVRDPHTGVRSPAPEVAE